ncbi:RNA-binding protein [Pontivivens ytuae]|uniref:RNA-binding protein n=1 Tax=Pontivivens ytuae TaxID=2789856 RepID=A0A7S9LPC3_9RHOB|nr:RNA-binding protein [Pontivivens ytuae]QPH52692.1 RNA-binding protein [Pontivivens ytuae]
MSRGGRTKDRETPERRCIATGTSGPKAPLVRFVVGPDDTVVPDIAEKLPGRGMWVSADRDAIALAAKKNLFNRAAKRQVKAPTDLPDLVERLLLRRVQDALALARKAGLAHMGFDTVKTRLRAGPVAALVEASDGSEPQRAKLRPLAAEAPLISCLSGHELGLAFGRDNVIHAALDGGGITDQVLREASRLAGLRGHEVVGTTDDAAPDGMRQTDEQMRGMGPRREG